MVLMNLYLLADEIPISVMIKISFVDCQGLISTCFAKLCEDDFYKSY